MKCLYFWSYLLIAISACCTTAAFRPNVCSRTEPIPYTEMVTKLVTVTYRKRTFFVWHTKQRNEYHSVPELRYKFEVQYFCCAGYEGSTDDCRPICHQGCFGHSHCEAPSRCECDDGYAGADCSPVCTGCFDNSFCSAPNTCECKVGYKRSSPNAACQPVCSPNCPDNNICEQPNHCECSHGYEKNAGKCIPICEAGCVLHSTCVALEECQCNKGYSWNNGSCLAVCAQACPDHSSCQEPELCVCHNGYAQRNQSFCEPQCLKGCTDYARCVAPDVCKCYDGHEFSESELKCQPKCSQGCPHGFCFAPEVCACSPGYLMGPNNSCEPQCTPSCINGNCSAPETCVCEPGYRFAPDSQHKCEPICEPACENGDCLGPQICICHVGHEPEVKSSSQHVCRPSCQMSCVHGTCVAPEQCSCNHGFVPADGISNFVCKPNCSLGCRNGICTRPEVCQCSAGYKLVDDGCVLEITLTTQIFATSSSPPDQLQLPITNCTNNCSCWQELTDSDFDDDDSIKCVNICMDDFDQPCLELNRCHCDNQSSLFCGIEQLQQRFICKVFKQVSPTINDNQEATGEAALNSSKTAPRASKWPAILAWCSGLCLLLLVLTVITHFYLKHRRQQVIARGADGISIISLEKDL